ncbi:MAG: SMP-30/gluconolactonase/LRE family protein [Saprospiraceae bacterium]|nr:SMP-30/gluconolactonase/LRE family protein [Saprospiraceae bacterium]MCF8250417.1 SMP-30/gluconolactonase/LRE family protein [Saprospiraceae bacterium]MCF8280663.1 SMP-30/gluconolactonase/LRE family protein [Bacteroidales bacterium]MCF8312208.1 SMP-30/gluconolactonase/LRE family protein [Saprospiraceae bacterium]MCF8440549.1 SMP-30/gluconolactonase/LRE family protein [Saprospiraceae bacterium]
MKFHHLLAFLLLYSCGTESESNSAEDGMSMPKTIGKIERISPDLDAIIAPDAKIEVIAEGFTWSEGPLWDENGGYVLFTDVPENKIFKWKEGEGISLYLSPSGFTGDKTDSTEPGANGLTLNAAGQLVMCQHGDRRVAIMDAPLDNPAPKFTTKADKWNGKRLNSPNDLVFDKNGNLYFTDPPYGLKGHAESPLKEIPFQGVYRVGADGKAVLLDSSLSRPNGIAFSPDEKTLFVANSDPERALWMAYDVQPDGNVVNGHVFHDATEMVSDSLKGLPDGMKIRGDGTIFATGPGGVLVFKMDGTLIGRINPSEATANCAIGGDGYLYLTSDMYLCRVKLVD